MSERAHRLYMAEYAEGHGVDSQRFGWVRGRVPFADPELASAWQKGWDAAARARPSAPTLST